MEKVCVTVGVEQRVEAEECAKKTNRPKTMFHHSDQAVCCCCFSYSCLEGPISAQQTHHCRIGGQFGQQTSMSHSIETHCLSERATRRRRRRRGKSRVWLALSGRRALDWSSLVFVATFVSLLLLVPSCSFGAHQAAGQAQTGPTQTSATPLTFSSLDDLQQQTTTTSIMTLAAGASLQHQESLMSNSSRQQAGTEQDLEDNSISVSASSVAQQQQQPQTASAVALPRPMTSFTGSVYHMQQRQPWTQQHNHNHNHNSQQHNQAGAHLIASMQNQNQIATSSKKAHSATSSAWQQNQNLNRLQKYLSEHQQELVKQNPGSLLAVARAIKMAIVECQYQMRNEPWDCPIYGFSIKPAEIFGMLMSRSFKETSFIQSLLSSAITHSVARACTESTISTCSRKQSPHGNGFAENFEFGQQFSQKFMDVTHELELQQQKEQQQLKNTDLEQQRAATETTATSSTTDSNNILNDQSRPTTSGGHHISNGPMWKERRLRYMINAHNDEFGRLLVLNGMRRECKCHGLSGACTLQTCWDKLPPFREVANRLHDSLDQAIRVEMYVAPQGSGLLANRHKSLTSSATINRKSNKKRSSSMQPSSSFNPSLNGFGRSMTAISQTAGLTSKLADEIGNGSGIGGSSRLQAYQRDGPIVASKPTSGHNHQDNGAQTEGSADSQTSREFAHNSLFTSSTISPVSSVSNTTNTMVKRRPIARSIGLTASTITPTKFDLLYAEESPDFCVPSERYNIKGTKGRICSESSNVSNSCERLCCGRGYKTEIREEKYKCECKFQFCCKLQCNTCTRRKVIHKCL